MAEANEKVMGMVERALKKDASMSNEELQQRAAKIAPAVRKLTPPPIPRTLPPADEAEARRQEARKEQGR